MKPLVYEGRDKIAYLCILLYLAAGIGAGYLGRFLGI